MSESTHYSHTLDIAIVVYHTPRATLEATLAHLFAALRYAHGESSITRARLNVIDNAAAEQSESGVSSVIDSFRAVTDTFLDVRVAKPSTNLGYGLANNTAFRESTAEFILVLNPDVTMTPDTVHNAITHLRAQSQCVMLSPVATFPDDSPQFLVKRHPDVFTLFLRGFAPRLIRGLFSQRMARYERSEAPFDTALNDCEIVSGCAMWIRGDAWRAIGGFDSRFFLYFEDFDLSLRLREHGEIHRVPACRITHAGGGASRKGFSHIVMFTRAMFSFFNKHGWRFF
jgi:GT2 family glycosyltransferase